MGNRVTGSTSPRAICFASTGSMSLNLFRRQCRHIWKKKDYLPSNVSFIVVIPFTSDLCEIDELFLCWAVHPLMQETFFSQLKLFPIARRNGFFPFQHNSPNDLFRSFPLLQQSTGCLQAYTRDAWEVITSAQNCHRPELGVRPTKEGYAICIWWSCERTKIFPGYGDDCVSHYVEFEQYVLAAKDEEVGVFS